MSQKSRGHRPPVQPKHASGRVSLEEALGQDSYTVPTLFGSPVDVPNTRARFYLGCVCISYLAVLVLTIVDMAHMTLSDRDAFAYALLVLLNIPMICYLCVHGLLRDRRIEMLAAILGSALLAAYEALDLFYHPRQRLPEAVKLIKLVRFCLMCSLQIPNVVLGLPLAFGPNRLEFVIAGGAREAQAMYRSYVRFESIQLFDLEAALSFVLLASFSQTQHTAEITMMVLGLVVTLLWMVWTRRILRKEQRGLVWVFYLFSLTVPAYAIYEVVELATHFREYRARSYLIVPMLVVLGIAVLLRIVLISACRTVISCFGRGLKESLVSGVAVRRPKDPQTAAVNDEHTRLLE